MSSFNIRVYGIIINEKNEVLVSDEYRFGRSFTKFPGGGLQWGEGTVECLKRELQEELGLDAEIGELFYVNEFSQLSAFHENDQLFSFYFKVKSIAHNEIKTSNHCIPLTEEGENFRWIPIAEISEDDMTFPLDKIVAGMLRQ